MSPLLGCAGFEVSPVYFPLSASGNGLNGETAPHGFGRGLYPETLRAPVLLTGVRDVVAGRIGRDAMVKSLQSNAEYVVTAPIKKTLSV